MSTDGDDKIGRTIRQYRVHSRLGVGGMGEVYKAEDTNLGRFVALKFLPSSYQYDPDRRARFFTEAQAVARLTSPHIAALYDMGEEGDLLFLVMEFVAGEALSDRLRRGALTVADSIEFAIQIGRALDEAHGKGIVHRDVKPANIIIDENGRAKVLDFGLAKIFDSPTVDPERLPTVVIPHRTVAGAVMGTVSYMSPEQALGRDVDHRSDLFSTGIVLFEMLTGALPFQGISSTEVIDNIVHTPLPPLLRYMPEAPEGLDVILGRLTEKSAAARYQRAAQFVADLERVRDGRGSSVANATVRDPYATVLASDPSSAPQAGHRRRTIALPNAIAVMTFENVTNRPEDEWIGSGIAETVSADLKSIRGIVVIGRERVFDAIRALTGGPEVESEDEQAIRIGRRLGARWIIAGGYQRIGESIRITARFLDVESGAVERSLKLDGQLSDIFDLQDKIVMSLTEGLRLSLGSSEIAAIERTETVSVEAYEHYSRGMTDLRSADRSAIDRAIEDFRQAIELDPRYSLAWAALGAATNLKGFFDGHRATTRRALDFAEKALAINQDLVFAHETLGMTYLNLGRFNEAVAALDAAARLAPGQATTHAALGRALWLGLGRMLEGVAELETAISIDPNLGYAYLQLALIYAILGRFDAAEAAAEQAIDLQEHASSGTVGLRIVGGHTRLGYVRYLQSRYEEAIAEYEAERRGLEGSDHGLRSRTLIELDVKEGAARLRLDDPEAARVCFERAEATFGSRVSAGSDDPFTRYYVACMAAMRGDRVRALEYLSSSARRLPAFIRARAVLDPDLDQLRDDPRFEAAITPGPSALVASDADTVE